MTKAITMIDLCFPTHHPQFDNENRLWFSSLDTREFDRTHDAYWSPFILDSNGNGRRDNWIEPGAKADPTKDTQIRAGMYGVVRTRRMARSGAVLGFPRGAMLFDPHTTVLEFYEVPWQDERYQLRTGVFLPVARISRATAWYGHRWRVAILRASTGARRPVRHAMAQEGL